MLTGGPEAAAAWAALATHRDTLDAVHGVHLALAQCGYGPHDPHVSYYLIIGVAERGRCRPRPPPCGAEL